MFNKYEWVEDVKDELLELAKEGHSEEELEERLNETIDSAVIYYADCWDIARELHLTDWSESPYPPFTNITQVAAFGLMEYAMESIDISAIVKQANDE